MQRIKSALYDIFAVAAMFFLWFVLPLAAALAFAVAAGAQTPLDRADLTRQQNALIERQAIIERNNYEIMRWHGEMNQGRVLGDPVPPLPPVPLPVPNPGGLPSPGVVRPRY